MSEWRPIESAPRDGTRVLLYDPDGYIHIAFSKDGVNWDDGDFYDHMTGFTHWMPIPAPPVAAIPDVEGEG